MPGIHFRHGSIRAYQEDMIRDVYSALEQKKHLLAHAPCGIGKTDAALSPAITYAMEHNLDVFFLTPKISQHRLAAEVIAGLAEKYSLELKATDMIGRRHSCIHPALEKLDYEAFYPSCERMRGDGKCLFYNNAKGSTRAEEVKAEILFGKLLSKYGSVKNHSELISSAREVEACPYEIMLKLSSNSRVIIADYFHLIEPKIRSLLLTKSKKKLENSIIIIDEAHNVPARVRDYLSVSFNSRMAARMEKEMRTMGARLKFEFEFNSWAKQFLGDEYEALVSVAQLQPLLAFFQMKPDEIASYFETMGVSFVQKTGKKSALLKFAKFLNAWFEDSPASVRMIRGKESFFSVSKRFMDPGIITSELNSAHSLILMSATLHPMPMYRDVLGLDPARTVMKSYPPPFPKSNKINFIVEGATTRFSRRTEEEFEKIAGIIDSVHALKGQTAAFFPSYKVMGAVLQHIKSKSRFTQDEHMGPRELHRLAKSFSAEGGLLLAVQGGSLAEGVDFNKGEIKSAIVVGIALEEMGLEIKSLIDYYQKKFGKGWEYAYIYPAVTRALQSAGRAIRKDEDKAAIIYLDERFGWNNYRKILPAGESFVPVKADELGKRLEAFWKS